MKRFVRSRNYHLDTQQPPLARLAGYRHAGNAWILQSCLLGPFVWNILVELHVQIRPKIGGCPSFFGSHLFLFALIALDEKVCLSSTRSWNYQLHYPDRHYGKHDHPAVFPMGMDYSISGSNPRALYSFFE